MINGVDDPEVTYGLDDSVDGKTVEAMARAAYIAQGYVGSRLEADRAHYALTPLKLLEVMHHIESPYMILTLEDELSMRNSLVQKVEAMLSSDPVRNWLADEAERLLAKSGAHSILTPEFEAHLRRLAANRPAKQ